MRAFRLQIVAALTTVALLPCACAGNGSGSQAGDSDDDDTDPGSDSDVDADSDADSDQMQASIINPNGDATIEKWASLDFESEAAGGTPPYQFQWIFDSQAPDSFEQSAGPIEFVTPGDYQITLMVTDAANQQAEDAITVTVEDLFDGMQPYYGNLHSHTDYSDGEGTPAEGFAFARDEAGLDFYAVTDHSEQLSGSEWDGIATQADLYEQPGVFAAIRGFEWSHPINGHVCVFDSDEFTAAFYTLWLNFFYDWLDESGAFAQFNHPGRELTAFNDMAYAENVADNFFGIETGNKGDGNNDGEFYEYYVMALDNGWRVAPTSNQDNHSLSVNSHRTVYIGDELSRAGLLEAMESRRIYSTDDPNLRIAFKLHDAWMGDIVTSTAAELTFTVEVTDDEYVTLLEIVSNGGEVVAEHAPPDGTTQVFWQPQVPDTGFYYFLKVTSPDALDDDGPLQIAYTAPIWVVD